MKIVWHSNAPWANTGYGQQTAVFAPRLKQLGHDVALSAFWGLGGAKLEWEGLPTYPADEKWGNLTLPRIAEEWGGEEAQVITLMDVWVLDSPSLAKVNIAAWTPVDHDPVPPKVAAFFDRTGATPIAMSRFGEQALRDEGLDPLYVPHGIDTAAFRPQPEVRDEVRELLDVPKDAFLVGMNAANKGIRPPRKAFPQVFQAFAELRRKHDDAYLFLHTELSGRHEGMNLGALADACGIPSEFIKATPPWRYETGLPPGDLAALYAAMDVFANPSYGEGFGIPIVEAQACGIPVIVTNFSAMAELCGAGWKVGGDRWYDPTQGSFFCCPSVGEITDAMLSAYESRGDQVMAKRARLFATDYDADKVLAEHWVPVLDKLEEARASESADRKPVEVEGRVA